MMIKLPQVFILALYLISLGISIERHGKPKKGNESAWTSLIATIIMLALLYWGGFFTGGGN